MAINIQYQPSAANVLGVAHAAGRGAFEQRQDQFALERDRFSEQQRQFDEGLRYRYGALNAQTADRAANRMVSRANTLDGLYDRQLGRRDTLQARLLAEQMQQQGFREMRENQLAREGMQQQGMLDRQIRGIVDKERTALRTQGVSAFRELLGLRGRMTPEAYERAEQALEAQHGFPNPFGSLAPSGPDTVRVQSLIQSGLGPHYNEKEDAGFFQFLEQLPEEEIPGLILDERHRRDARQAEREKLANGLEKEKLRINEQQRKLQVSDQEAAEEEAEKLAADQEKDVLNFLGKFAEYGQEMSAWNARSDAQKIGESPKAKMPNPLDATNIDASQIVNQEMDIATVLEGLDEGDAFWMLSNSGRLYLQRIENGVPKMIRSFDGYGWLINAK